MTNPFNPSLASTINVVRAALRDLGHDLPESLTAAMALADTATKVPATLRPDSAKAARRWWDLYTSGKDPARDPEILGLLTRNTEAVRGLELSLAELAEATKAEALAEAADPIVETLQGVVTEAQEHIDEARERIGLVITETRVSGLSPDNVRLHARAREAFVRTDLARRAWVALAKQFGRANWRPGHAEEILIFADLDLAGLSEIAGRVGRARSAGAVVPTLDKYDARTVIATGHRLDLADFDSFRERLALVAEEAQRQHDAEKKQARKKAHDGIDPARMHATLL
ncbi:hypothetical protein ABT304_05805 [Nocardioides sp. NPDC000445]|uniref:hypothetical protein n=1 Tax=Nocardioides sp. NPDC000445 TaxID=3154257 RepID=UPI003334429A